MAIPALKLNLVPAPSLWRQHHQLLGWTVLVAGISAAGVVAFLTGKAYYQARKAGQKAVTFTTRARSVAAQEGRLVESLAAIDVTRELPRWRLAERILTERSTPWSRITAELERSLVDGIRLKSIQRIRQNNNQGVVLKLRAEARTREAEVDFMDQLRENPYFLPLILERESERTGGGVDLDFTLPINLDPPAYEALPQHGRAKATPVSAAPPAPAPIPAPSLKRTPTPPPMAPTAKAPVMRPQMPPPQPEPALGIQPDNETPRQFRMRRPGMPAPDPARGRSPEEKKDGVPE